MGATCASSASKQRLAAVPTVDALGHRGGELRQLAVQVRRADLERDAHAGAIGLDEHVVRQPMELVEEHELPYHRARGGAVERAAPDRR